MMGTKIPLHSEFLGLLGLLARQVEQANGVESFVFNKHVRVCVSGSAPFPGSMPNHFRQN